MEMKIERNNSKEEGSVPITLSANCAYHIIG